MTPFATEHHPGIHPASAVSQPAPAVWGSDTGAARAGHPSASASGTPIVALRRCRQPVPARVVVEAGRPVRVTSDRRGFSGGAVLAAEGPWRTSGHWWDEASPAAVMAGPWDRDEWEVALTDGARYRVFRDRAANAWFIDGMFD